MENESMRKVGRQMSLCMGVTLSFFLSLVGMLSSGHFALPGWLISFVVSTIVSLIIGFFVPMKKVTGAACRKCRISEGTLKARFFESLLSDLIYTPVITFFMVGMAYVQARSHGAQMPFLISYGKSLVICMVVGYVLIFFFMPLFFYMIMKKNKKKS